MSWSIGMQGSKEQIAAKLDEQRAAGHMPDDHYAAVHGALDAVPGSVTLITISANGHRAAAANASPLSNLSILVSGAR